MPLESSIEGSVTTWAEGRDIQHLKLNVRGRKGWPDHLYVKNGKCVFVEYKQPGEPLEPIQEYVQGLLSAEGMIVQVHDNVEEACAALARVFFETA